MRLKMLVRALKVLRFFSKTREPARTSTRQPLISRAMKVGLMAEEAPNGNDEPPKGVPLPTRRLSAISRFGAGEMAHFQPSTTRLSPFSGLRTPRWLPVFAVLAAIAAPDSADARSRTSYDGNWNVVFATTRGNCGSGYSVPFMVSGSRVSGSVNRNGAVAVNVSVGASRASGGGRLAGASGAGAWRGIITGDRCSGTWRAVRS